VKSSSLKPWVVLICALAIGVLLGSQTFPRIQTQRLTQTVTDRITATSVVFNNCPLTLFSVDKPRAMGGGTYTTLPSLWWANGEGTLWAFPFSNETHAGSEGGLKVLWVRTDGGTFSGSKLTIQGIQLYGLSTSIRADIPCCYDSNYQASGLYFPNAGCWMVTGKVDNSSLSFTIYVNP
jgi:hypothetical protein